MSSAKSYGVWSGLSSRWGSESWRTAARKLDTHQRPNLGDLKLVRVDDGWMEMNVFGFS